MNHNFVQEVGRDFDLEPSEPIMSGLFQQYERVLMESLASSFALDFLVKDQHGGDVDTIYNVRQITDDDDSPMKYKNKKNQQDYEQQVKQTPYDKDAYHGKNKNYQQMTADARAAAKQEGKPVPIEDAYTGGTVYLLGKSKGAPSDQQASVDHVIPANSIYRDRGRVLAGLSGEELANAPENLVFTNQSLNSSMRASDIPAYIEAHPELDAQTKERMMQIYNRAKKAYDAKINRAYYTSPKFAKDVAKAAGNVGIRMGVRQALGFVFVEIWFAIKAEFQEADKEQTFDFKEFLERIGRGLRRGYENAKTKYADLFSRFLNGATAGALSSVTTTLCNIFFTTAKNVVRMIRQAYPSLVQAVKVLFINPECYTFGERMRAVAKILATGASVVMGVAVGDAVSKTPVAAIPVLQDIVPAFCGAFVSGIMSCTFLYFLDRSSLINRLVKKLDNLHTIETEVNYYRQQAEYFERYAAELMEIDLEALKKETALYCNASDRLANAKTSNDLNIVLKDTFESLNITLPWGDHEFFSDFMEDESAHLVFE